MFIVSIVCSFFCDLRAGLSGVRSEVKMNHSNSKETSQREECESVWAMSAVVSRQPTSQSIWHVGTKVALGPHVMCVVQTLWVSWLVPPAAPSFLLFLSWRFSKINCCHFSCRRTCCASPERHSKLSGTLDRTPHSAPQSFELFDRPSVLELRTLHKAKTLPLAACRKAATERPSHGWHLVNYVGALVERLTILAYFFCILLTEFFLDSIFLLVWTLDFFALKCWHASSVTEVPALFVGLALWLIRTACQARYAEPKEL